MSGEIDDPCQLCKARTPRSELWRLVLEYPGGGIWAQMWWVCKPCLERMKLK